MTLTNTNPLLNFIPGNALLLGNGQPGFTNTVFGTEVDFQDGDSLFVSVLDPFSPAEVEVSGLTAIGGLTSAAPTIFVSGDGLFLAPDGNYGGAALSPTGDPVGPNYIIFNNDVFATNPVTIEGEVDFRGTGTSFIAPVLFQSSAVLYEGSYADIATSGASTDRLSITANATVNGTINAFTLVTLQTGATFGGDVTLANDGSFIVGGTYSNASGNGVSGGSGANLLRLIGAFTADADLGGGDDTLTVSNGNHNGAFNTGSGLDTVTLSGARSPARCSPAAAMTASPPAVVLWSATCSPMAATIP